MICDLCLKKYDDIFDSTLRIDYTFPGKGKLHEYHICQNCRKNLLENFESNSKNNNMMEKKKNA